MDCENILYNNLIVSNWSLQKLKKDSTRTEDGQYYGRITDAAIDGAIDYKNRPADKSKTGRWPAVLFIMGNQFLPSGLRSALICTCRY